MAIPDTLSNFVTGTLTGLVSGSDHGSKANAINKLEARVIKDAPINVEWDEYGADPAASTATNRAAIQAAIDVAEGAAPTRGREVLLPRLYNVDSTGLSFEQDGIKFMGLGRYTSGVSTAAGNLIKLGTAGVSVGGLTFKSMTISVAPGGGHVFTPLNGLDKTVFDDLKVVQTNTGKSLWEMNDTGPYIDNLWTNCEFEHSNSATVPGFNMIMSTAVEGINANTWERCRCSNAGNFFFHIECTVVSNYNFDNAFRDLNMEITNGGVLKMLGAQGFVVENVNIYDLGTTTKDMFFVGKSASGSKSLRNTFHNVNRRGGTLGGGLVDINVDDAYFTTIDHCDSGTGGGFTIDLNGNPYQKLHDLADNVTVLNLGEYSDWDGGGYGTVASATSLTLPLPANVFSVTGTTTITSIAAGSSIKGREVTLIFAGALTFTQGSNLKLNSAAGSFVTTSNDAIHLVCDGTNWIERGRSVNAA